MLVTLLVSKVYMKDGKEESDKLRYLDLRINMFDISVTWLVSTYDQLAALDPFERLATIYANAVVHITFNGPRKIVGGNQRADPRV